MARLRPASPPPPEGKRRSATLWTYEAKGASVELFRVSLESLKTSSSFFDQTTENYVRDLSVEFLEALSLEQRITAVPNLIPRIMAVSSLTGPGAMAVEVADGAEGPEAVVSIAGCEVGERLIVQIPHSVGMALFPRIIDPSPNEIFVYRKAVLGDETTGLYYVTVAARGEDQAALDAMEIVKNGTFSTAGTVGTFAVDINGAAGLFLHSVTVTTYTQVETQAKLVVVIDNPQGPVKAHEAVRPSATLITGNGTQLSTPTVVLTGADGAVPSTNGVPHQLDPAASYGHIRVSAVGLVQATSNVVSDASFNKAQSLVIQF